MGSTALEKNNGGLRADLLVGSVSNCPGRRFGTFEQHDGAQFIEDALEEGGKDQQGFTEPIVPTKRTR